MLDRATPALRWSRALVLAGVAYALGLAAHLSAGGLVPGPVGLGVLFALTLVGSAGFLGRAASTLRVTALLMGGQAFIHAALTASAGHAGDPATHAVSPVAPVDPTAVARRGSLYDVYARATHARTGAADGPGVPDWAQHLADDLTGPHALMAIAHLVAAALVGLWLASGERALWGLVRLSRQAFAATLRHLSAALGTVTAATPRTDVVVRLDGLPARRLHASLLGTTHARRGPPALLAA
jgi:hypothetical protein